MYKNHCQVSSILSILLYRWFGSVVGLPDMKWFFDTVLNLRNKVHRYTFNLGATVSDVSAISAPLRSDCACLYSLSKPSAIARFRLPSRRILPSQAGSRYDDDALIFRWRIGCESPTRHVLGGRRRRRRWSYIIKSNIWNGMVWSPTRVCAN